MLLYNDNDYRKLDKRITDNFPEKEYIKKVYEHLAYYYQIAIGFGYNKTFEFNIDKFCHIFKYFPIQVEAALRILDKAGYIEYMEEQDNSARVMFTLERDELYRLKNNSPTEEKVVVALLRNYSGLFCDYNYIDESFIASQCGLTSHEVYDTLKQLNHKGVISFIPRKRIPFIKYTQRREEKEYIVINKDVYDNRKEQFCKRINAVKNFTMDYRCRSRQLLEYFGETSENDCNQCDVCLEKNKSFHSKDKIKDTRNKISVLLADGKKHHVTELHNFHIPSETLNKVLHYMMTEEEIFQEDGYLFSPNR